MPREQAAEHGAVVVQHRIVAVLVQVGRRQLDLAADDAAAVDSAAQHPVALPWPWSVPLSPFSWKVRPNSETTTTTVWFQVVRPDLVGEAGEAPAQLAEPSGQVARGAALVDVGVPAADVDEAEVELGLASAARCAGPRARTPWARPRRGWRRPSRCEIEL